MFQSIKSKYEDVLQFDKSHPSFKDTHVYKGEDILKYPNSFLAYVDPTFVQDMVTNSEWYQTNFNQFLLNMNYPSKLQTDFMKMIELGQQRRHD